MATRKSVSCSQRRGQGAPRRLPDLVFAACLASLVFATPAQAASPANARARSAAVNQYFSDLLLSLQKRELRSGLRVVLLPDQSAPQVALAVSFPTGFSSEPELGHGALELVDFVRHRTLPDAWNPDFELALSHGVRWDKDFGWNHTSFVDVVPDTELAFGLWLEAERLRAPEQVKERAWQQARWQRTALELLEPRRAARLTLRRLLSGTPTAGADAADPWPALESSFFSARHAVLTLVGNFDAEQASRWISRYFSDAAEPAPRYEPDLRDASPPRSTATNSREQPRERPERRAILLGFQAPPAPHPDYRALEIAGEMLRADADSPTDARFLRSARARRLRAWLQDGKSSSLFCVALELGPGADEQRAVTLLKRRIDALGRRASNPGTLERAKRRALVRWLSHFTSLDEQARLLGRFEVLHGDARLVTRRHLELGSVTLAALKQATQRLLQPSRATLLSLGSPTGGQR